MEFQSLIANISAANPAWLAPYFGKSSQELHPQITPHNAITIMSINA